MANVPFPPPFNGIPGNPAYTGPVGPVAPVAPTVCTPYQGAQMDAEEKSAIVTAAEDEMSAVDFVLWLNGAFDVLDATPPTQAQWDKMRDRIAEQMGRIVASRIRRASQPYEFNKIVGGTLAQASAKMATIQAYQAQIDAYKAKTDVYAQLAAISMSAVNLNAKITGR